MPNELQILQIMNKNYQNANPRYNSLNKRDIEAFLEFDDEQFKQINKVEFQAKQNLMKILQTQTLGNQTKQQNIAKKQNFNFNKLSGWQEERQYRSNLGKLPIFNRPFKNSKNHQSIVTSSQKKNIQNKMNQSQYRYSHTLVNNLRKKFQAKKKTVQLQFKNADIVSEDYTKPKSSKVTNADLDNLIKEVMNYKHQQFTDINITAPPIPITTFWRTKNPRPSTSLTHKSPKKENYTIDYESQVNKSEIKNNNFPIRKVNKNLVFQRQQKKSKTISLPDNSYQRMKKIIQRMQKQQLMKKSERFQSLSKVIINNKKKEVGIIGRKMIIL